MQSIYRKHSRACDHNYLQNWQVLDLDMTGLPAGTQGKGYFSGVKKRRGRQLGRVIATSYDEIVLNRLYTGNRQLCPVMDWRPIRAKFR